MELIELDARVEAALASGDESALDVIAYGEISVVLRLASAAGPLACKRLPVFRGEHELARYRACFDRYLRVLNASGVHVVPSELKVVPRGDGSVVAYCVQPLLEADALASRVLRRASENEARALFAQVVTAIMGVVSDRVGLDAQLSNWVYEGGALRYLDVTTPLLRTPAGANELDADLFLAALPALLRAPVKRWLLSGITDKYHSPRGVIVDAIANLYKERQTRWLSSFIAVANRVVTPAISAAEVEQYYKADARTWAALLWLRHADRAWHRRVLHRPYAFLLPRRIERHV